MRKVKTSDLLEKKLRTLKTAPLKTTSREEQSLLLPPLVIAQFTGMNGSPCKFANNKPWSMTIPVDENYTFW